MKFWWSLLLRCMALLLVATLPGCGGEVVDTSERRPNILLIVADDMGYSDLGAFGGEIETPNLDTLASAGTLLANFHTAPTCSPTRAMLLSGVDSHRAGLGNMAELLAESQRGQPGYEGYLNDAVLSVADLLQEAGYHTIVSGKWHLGREPGQLPPQRGFDQSFVLLQGGGSYFDQRGLSPHDPVSLYRENGRPARLPEGVYASNYYTDRLLRFLETTLASEQPFFAYLAFTAPHWPLQVPNHYRDKYEPLYAQGWHAIRDARLSRLGDAGLLPSVPSGADPLPEWSGLSEEQRRDQARRMAIYAGMIDNLDHNVGRVVDWLRTRGALDDTLVIFLSDNGATTGSQFDRVPVVKAWLDNTFDNRYDNRGEPGSYVEYGPHWALVSNTPFKGFKGATHEGGTRVPAFIKWPGGAPGLGVSHDLFSVLDIAPTLIEVAGIALPEADEGGRMVHDGRRVFAPQGQSLVGSLRDPREAAPPSVSRWALEFAGHRAAYDGHFKAVYARPPAGSSTWQLFDLQTDPGETADLANEQVERLERLKHFYSDYSRRNGVIELPPNYSPAHAFLRNADR